MTTDNNSTEETSSDLRWQRGDVVLDDSGNLFCYHDRWGWYGLASNQASARGPQPAGEHPYEPITLLVRGNQAVAAAVRADERTRIATERAEEKPAADLPTRVRCRRCGKTVRCGPDGEMRAHKMFGNASRYCLVWAG